MRRRDASGDHSTSGVVVIDIETIVPNSPAGAGDGFVKWPHHQPVVASLLGATALGEGRFRFWLDSILFEPGKEAAFYAAVNERIPPYGTLIGHNSTGFDIAALAIGAVGARCFSAANLLKMHRAYRFGPLHADLAELYSNHGAAPRPSLAEVCGRLGVPVKVSTHGSEVAELHAAGRIGEIVAYCESDVAATYAAWLHWAAWRDGDEALLAEPLASFSRWIEASPDRVHLLPVARCEPARWARERALALSLDHARVRIERRARQECDERAFRGELVTADNDDDDLIF